MPRSVLEAELVEAGRWLTGSPGALESEERLSVGFYDELDVGEAQLLFEWEQDLRWTESLLMA